MEPEELFDQWLEGTVYKDRQVDPRGVHLTVGKVLRMHSRGHVDFGGDEMRSAKVHPLETTEHTPGDQYAWWRLEEGTYLILFNERLKDGAPPVLLVPNVRLVTCGCSLDATLPEPGEISTVLQVPKNGVNIKENARIALLRPL